MGIKLLVFILFGFYDRWWRYVSTRDMWGAARGVTVASLVADVTVYFASPVADVRLPRSIAVMDWLLLLAFIAGSRLIARSVFERPTPGRLVARGKEVLVIGAGEAARDTIREMHRNPQLGYTPIGLVDDDPRKKNIRIHGVRVLGTTADLPHLLRDNKPDEILIAVPSASGEFRRAVVTTTRELGVRLRAVGLEGLAAGRARRLVFALGGVGVGFELLGQAGLRFLPFLVLGPALGLEALGHTRLGLLKFLLRGLFVGLEAGDDLLATFLKPLLPGFRARLEVLLGPRFRLRALGDHTIEIVQDRALPADQGGFSHD